MKRELILIFTLIFITGLVFAVPSLPHTFIGEVDYSGTFFGTDPLEGYDISASIGSYGLGILGQVQEGNTYEVFVDPQGRTGEITFYIGGVEATPTAEYEWGGHTEDLDLTIDEMPTYALCGNGIQEPGEQCDGNELGTGTCENVLGIPEATGTLSCTDICTFDYSNCSAPYCGDGTCNPDETCTSCPVDCGACSTGGNGGNGGGGGGGGGGSPSGIITLTTNNTETNNDIDNLTYEDIELNSEEDKKTTSSGITGGMIGFVQSGIGAGLIIGIMIIIVGIGVITLRRRSSKNE